MVKTFQLWRGSLEIHRTYGTYRMSETNSSKQQSLIKKFQKVVMMIKEIRTRHK